MKNKKYYTIVSILVLFVIVLLQFNSFYNNAYANYIIQPFNEIDRNNYDNVMYVYIMDALKLKLNDNDNNITIVIDDDFRNYTVGLNLERAFSATYLYPRKVTEVRFSSEINDWMIDYFKSCGSRTLIFLGRNMSFLSETLDYDINIYDLDEDNNLIYREGFNSDLYSLSLIYKEYNIEKNFDKLLDVTIKTAKVYNNLSAKEELKKLAEQYYENSNYKSALKYYKIYSNYDNSIEITGKIDELYKQVGGDDK